MASDPLTLTISVAAIAVSIWAILSARATARSQQQLQERFLSFESARERDRKRTAASAFLRASIRRGGNRWDLMIYNDGSREARFIKTTINGKPILQHDLVPQGLQEVTRLGSGAEASYLLGVASGAPPIITVTLEWEDDSGVPGRWSSELNIF